jgi:hypothetical protein
LCQPCNIGSAEEKERVKTSSELSFFIFLAEMYIALQCTCDLVCKVKRKKKFMQNLATLSILTVTSGSIDYGRDALDRLLQASRYWTLLRGAPPGVIWDKLRAQQAICLLNKPSARHVLMILLSVSLINFFQFNLLCSNCQLHHDGQAGKAKTDHCLQQTDGQQS